MFCMFYMVNCEMKNCREEWYDKDAKVAVTLVDVTDAAQALARGHLCGPTSAYFLSKALAAAALLGGEMSEDDETLILQMKCKGPLGGFNVECTAAGTLRGYTEKKILDDFDGMGVPDPRKAVGEKQLQVTRSVPGRILSQGISNSLDGYLAGSLQRKAVIFLEAAVSDDVEILEARGVMVEEDLRDALLCGHLGGACIDVLSVEPMEEDCVLMGVKNCIITPHIAWAPLETRERLMGIVADNIRGFLEGAPKNVVS